MIEDLGIQGIQEAQEANARVIAALKPSGKFGEAIRWGTMAAQRYAVSITHVWIEKGGGLRASHRMAVDLDALRGTVYIDPDSVNPRGQKPSVYGPYEHARGGSHAFYERTEREAGPMIQNEVANRFLGGLP